MNFSHYIPTRILFGPGQLEQLGKVVLSGKKALIVISAGTAMKSNGYLRREPMSLLPIPFPVLSNRLLHAPQSTRWNML